MGWISEPNEDEKDKFPVDTLVKKLKDETYGTESVCEDYHGQARKCCDGIRICFVTLEESFSTVKLQAIGNQNMHKACRRLTTDLEATKSCIVSWTGYCHGSVNTETLSAPFHDTLDTLKVLLNESCSDLPPEGTTQKVSSTTIVRKTSAATEPASSTSSTTTATLEIATTILVKGSTLAIAQNSSKSSPNNGTEEITDNVNKLHSSTASSTDEPGKPNHPSNNRPGPTQESTTRTTQSSTFSFVSTSEQPLSTNHSTKSSPSVVTTSSTLSSSEAGAGSGLPRLDGDQREKAEGDNTIILISSAVGSFLFLCVIALCIFIMYKKRQQKNSDSGGSYEPDRKSKVLSWLFQSSKNAASVQTDTEIYAEIDEAFMEAVYKHDKEKPNIGRDRISSNTQFNMCYESGPNDDNIIPSRQKANVTEANILSLQPLNPLALIRKEDDAITSFQIDQSKTQDRQNMANALSNTNAGFLTRRPGFTDIRPGSSGGEYVYIEAKQNDDVFIDDQNYAVPTFGVSEYDTAEYGRNPDRNISQAPEQNYYSYLVYNNEPNVQQNVKEYRRSSSDVETHVYENQDTLMEY